LNDYERNFYYVGSAYNLDCPNNIPKTILDNLKSSFSNDFVSAQDLYFAYFTQKTVDEKVLDEPTKTKIGKNLAGILKKDDSLQNLGYGFYIAAELGAPGSFVVDRVEDAIVQADEVNGQMLQFEGGLSITALVFNGAYKVASTFKKSVPLTADQLVKFANYFLSRRSVTVAKGASLLLESIQTLSQQNEAPICIRIADNGQLQPEQPILKVKVSGLLGEELKQKPAALKVTAISKQSNQKLVDGETMTPTAGDLTVYKLDLKGKNLAKGVYKIEVVAGDFKQSNLLVNILGKVKLEKVEIGISETDSQTQTKKATLEYGKKLSEVFQLDHQQKITIKFDLFDALTNKIISVHQAFVRFSNQENSEIIFIAEQDLTKAYKFDMDVGARSSDFGYKSGTYSVELIIGDSSLVNSFKWTLGEINLKFQQEAKKEAGAPLRQKRPEIHHKFREPEKRPPKFLSDLFTGLCLAPILILFILWIKLGVNLSNFTFGLSTFGFHLGFGAIFALYLCFWLKLNMFQTLQYLLPIALFTFLSGNRLLRAIAKRRLEKEKI
jgi:oligosaccharyltransferase complex subunit delta (ribophorin II)